MSEVRAFLITLRSHPSETYLTNTFLTYLLPFLDSQLRYCYAYEEYGRLSEHIHIYVETNFRDKDKVLRHKIFKECVNKIQKVCADKQTIYTPKWEEKANQIKIVNKGEELKTLGYVFKETDTEAKKFQGKFTNEEILTAVDVYYKERLIDKSKIGKDSWTYLTNNQAHAVVEKYCEDNQLHINHHLLRQKMQADGYSFAKLSARFESNLWQDLALRHSNIFTSSEKDEMIIRSEQMKHNVELPSSDSGYQELFKHNQAMLSFIKSNGLMNQFTEHLREYDMLLDPSSGQKQL